MAITYSKISASFVVPDGTSSRALGLTTEKYLVVPVVRSGGFTLASVVYGGVPLTKFLDESFSSRAYAYAGPIEGAVNDNLVIATVGQAYGPTGWAMSFNCDEGYPETLDSYDANVPPAGWHNKAYDPLGRAAAVCAIAFERGSGSDWSHLNKTPADMTQIDGSNVGERHRYWWKAISAPTTVGTYNDHQGTGGSVMFAAPAASRKRNQAVVVI